MSTKSGAAIHKRSAARRNGGVSLSAVFMTACELPQRIHAKIIPSIASVERFMRCGDFLHKKRVKTISLRLGYSAEPYIVDRGGG
jgi:hypothetical protein